MTAPVLSATPAFAEKVKALAALEFEPAGESLGTLFYAARNLAIEALLRNIEVRLLRMGFPAECSWDETSFGATAQLRICMRNTGSGSWTLGTCLVMVARHKMPAPAHVSSFLYSASSFEGDEYWGAKQPAKLLQFRQAVQALWDSGELSGMVLGINHPFERPFHSSF